MLKPGCKVIQHLGMITETLSRIAESPSMSTGRIDMNTNFLAVDCADADMAKSINAKEIIGFFIFILVLVCISYAKISIFSLTQRYIFIIFRCFCTILFVICYFFTIFAEK